MRERLESVKVLTPVYLNCKEFLAMYQHLIKKHIAHFSLRKDVKETPDLSLGELIMWARWVWASTVAAVFAINQVVEICHVLIIREDRYERLCDNGSLKMK